MDKKTKSSYYINFGAGNPALGWDNLDSSPTFAFPIWVHKILNFLGLSKRSKHFCSSNYQYYKFNSSKKLPFQNNTVSAIYTSHVPEHLSLAENVHFFNESYRILKSGGVIRVLVPDLQKKLVFSEAMFSLDDQLLTLPSDLKSNKVRAALEAAHGFPSFHKTMFVSKYLAKTFGDRWRVKQNLNYLQSSISKEFIQNVEIRARTENAIIFELIKK